jgi:hypothetical protein
MQKARLIPVSGIGTDTEAEQRATSALLAVVSIVRDLSIDLLSPLGASKAQKATVETFTEVLFDLNGKKVRPDGLIRVGYGKTVWTALVEVKTSNATLDAEQINAYWDVARAQGFNHVLTISNEIAPIPGQHPTPGLRFQKNSPVQVSHLSWTAILTSAIRIKQHRGVTDPEQAWILAELIRYLQHKSSGALAFDDMGDNWVHLRDDARKGTLSRRDEAVADIAGRFDQLIHYAALILGSQIGEDVAPVLSRKELQDPAVRLTHLIEALVKDGTLDGALRIPNTAGDLGLTADLRSQQLAASLQVDAPQDRGAKGRITWLINQLREAPASTSIEAFAKNARTPIIASLGDARENRGALLGDDHREPVRFRLVLRGPMGTLRKNRGKHPGFIDSALNLITSFYETIVQDVSPWQPSTPKVKRSEPEAEGQDPTESYLPPTAVSSPLADEES